MKRLKLIAILFLISACSQNNNSHVKEFLSPENPNLTPQAENEQTLDIGDENKKNLDDFFKRKDILDIIEVTAENEFLTIKEGRISQLPAHLQNCHTQQIMRTQRHPISVKQSPYTLLQLAFDQPLIFKNAQGQKLTYTSVDLKLFPLEIDNIIYDALGFQFYTDLYPQNFIGVKENELSENLGQVEIQRLRYQASNLYMTKITHQQVEYELSLLANTAQIQAIALRVNDHEEVSFHCLQLAKRYHYHLEQANPILFGERL